MSGVRHTRRVLLWVLAAALGAACALVVFRDVGDTQNTGHSPNSDLRPHGGVAGESRAGLRAGERPHVDRARDAGAGASQRRRALADGPVLHPRDPMEWQGRRVDVSRRAVCRDATTCGLALACLEGLCGPCTTDADCASGESCVLDHCLLPRLVSCRSRIDCHGGYCVLQDEGEANARGNQGLRAVCLTPTGPRRGRS